MINLGTSTMQDFALGDNLVERIDLGDTTIFDPYTTLTGTLPLSFNSRVAGALKNYRIYGTSAGSGTPTESGEPAGYKIPILNTSGGQQSNYDLFIGSTKLGAEEYLDYGEQKVYKKGTNLWTNTIWDGYINYAIKHNCACERTANGIRITATGSDPYVGDVFWKGAYAAGSNATNISIEVEESTTYTLRLSSAPKCYISYIDSNRWGLSYEKITPSEALTDYVFTTPQGCKYIVIRFGKYGISIDGTYEWTFASLSKGSAYLTPTDPPAPLPTIQTYQGENTLSSTETLGEVTVKGRISEISP